MNWLRIRVIAVLFAPLLTGCGPADVDLVWLSDSSAFVRIEDKALVMYDVQRKAERTIVSLDWLESRHGRPAVDPAGKRVALLRLHQTAKTLEFSIHIFGMDGERIGKSPMLRVQRKPNNDDSKEETVCGYAEWSPNGDNIVFVASSGLFDAREPTLGFYNIRTRTIRQLPELWPFPSCVYGASCCSPDGKGFLALRKSPDGNEGIAQDEGAADPELVFVTWDGWVYDVSVPKEAIEVTKACCRKEFSLHPAAHWSGDKMIVSATSVDKLLQIDVPKRQVSVVQANTELIEYARRKRVELVFPIGDGFVLQISGKSIQVAQPKAGAAKTLVSAATDVHFDRAPDGMRTVVRYTKDKSSHLLVVDSQGNVVTNRKR